MFRYGDPGGDRLYVQCSLAIVTLETSEQLQRSGVLQCWEQRQQRTRAFQEDVSAREAFGHLYTAMEISTRSSQSEQNSESSSRVQPLQMTLRASEIYRRHSATRDLVCSVERETTATKGASIRHHVI